MLHRPSPSGIGVSSCRSQFCAAPSFAIGHPCWQQPELICAAVSFTIGHLQLPESNMCYRRIENVSEEETMAAGMRRGRTPAKTQQHE